MYFNLIDYLEVKNNKSCFMFSVLVGVHLATTPSKSPEWEGTTDIPEEIEVGEDVTTNNSSIPTTPPANGTNCLKQVTISDSNLYANNDVLIFQVLFIIIISYKL